MINLSDEFTRDELAEMFQYLDDLRESGVTNMFGASPYLQFEYGLEDALARTVLASWMQTYNGKAEATQRAQEALR
jgi:hypothetical protein